MLSIRIQIAKDAGEIGGLQLKRRGGRETQFLFHPSNACYE